MSDGTPSQPPGQRRVVVLREGPPKGRGRTLDGVLGALGAALLLLAVVLANVLPEETVPDPQYRVEYQDNLVENLTSFRSADLLPEGILLPGEGNAFLVPIEVEHNNVYEVVGYFFFEEDRPETLPDVFMVELLDPDGEVVQRSNPQPTLPTCDIQDENGGDPYTTPGEYYQTCTKRAGQETRIAFNLGGKPADRIVTLTDGENATLEEATQAIVQEDTVPTVGTWHMRLWLEEVGQCPPSADGVGVPSQSQQKRATLCRLAVEQDNGGPGGEDDPGNPFVVNTEYRYYTIQVSEV